jgi:hypothetical protein
MSLLRGLICCLSAVSVFRHASEIVEKGAYSAVVSVKKAIADMNTDSKSHFIRGELQLLRVHLAFIDSTIIYFFLLQETSSNRIASSHSFNSLNNIPNFTFTQLSSSSEYSVRLVLFEANNLHDLENSPTVSFTTNDCVDLGKLNKI